MGVDSVLQTPAKTAYGSGVRVFGCIPRLALCLIVLSAFMIQIAPLLFHLVLKITSLLRAPLSLRLTRAPLLFLTLAALPLLALLRVFFSHL